MSDGDIINYVGAATIKKMRDTKLHMLARALSDVLYDCDVVDTETTKDGVYWKPVPVTAETRADRKRFVVSLQVFVNDRVTSDQGAAILAREGYVDVKKLLLELMHECEMLALREVT